VLVREELHTFLCTPHSIFIGAKTVWEKVLEKK